MTEIGVLNLTIHDNSENAAKGLDRLAGALRAVKEAKQKFNLDTVGQQLTNLAKTIQETRGTSTIIKNLGTMFNAINQFSKLKDFTIDAQKLRDTAQSMIQLADAKERVDTVNKSTAGVGDWRTGMNGIAESTKAAVNEVKKDVDVFEDTIKRAKDVAGDSKGTWEMAMRLGAFSTAPSGRGSGSMLPLNLQLFGGKWEVDGLKETEGVIQQSTETISKFKEAVSDTADPVKNIDLNKYLGTPLESIFNKATMAETAIRRVGDAMAHALTNMSGSAMEKAIAGNAKLATQEISGLFKMLEKKPKYDGLRQFVDAITGVTRGAQGGNVINENTTMLGPIVEQEEKLERLNARIEEATAAHYKLNEAGELYAGTIRIFDQAEGRYKEISVDAKAIAESTADAKEKTEDFTSSIRNVIDLTKVPASGKNGVFANAAEEAKYLKEQIESTIASQEQWLSIRAAAEKQIKYGGPRSKEDLDFDMRHSEEGYYAALEAEEQYKNSLTDLLGYAKEYTETARQATEATTQQAESMNTAADAAERLKDAVAESASADVIAAQAAVNQHAIQQLMDTLNNPPNVRFVDIVDDLNGVDRTAMSARESMSAFLEAMQGDDEYASYIRDLNPELAELSDSIAETSGNFRDLQENMEVTKDEIDLMAAAFGDLDGAMGRMFPTLSNLLKRFKSMTIMRGMRYIIRQISAGFSEGIQNLYEYSKIVGSDFVPAMDQAATALQQMKNSVGAAVAPAIIALVPVLQTVVNWFITLVNYANQFIALMTGQKTWVRALPETAEAFESQKKKAKGASDAMKDLLADWDELNIIQSQSGGGAGSTGKHTEEEYRNMFETVDEFDKKVRDVVDGIKDEFGDILGFAKRIGALIAAWKISAAFGGVLGTLAALAGTIIDLDLVFKISHMFMKKYLDTGNKGWLIADLLTPMIGGLLAKKMLTKVLGKGVGSVAIPLSFVVSAIADITALVGDTDVTALSEEGILAAINTAIKGGVAAGAALYSLGGYSLLTAVGGGVGAALFTFGATIGIKATADVVETREITKDTVKADLLSAGLIGTGLMIAEAVLGGTIGTIVAVGGAGVLFTLGALLAVQYAITKAERKAIKWAPGAYKATESEIKAFVEEQVFTTDAKTILNLIDPVIKVKEDEENKLKADVEEVKLTAKKLTLGFDDKTVLDDLKEQVFGNSEKGTDGIMGQFRRTVETEKNVIETGITIVPSATNPDGTTKEIVDKTSEGWTLLLGHMDDLGKELSTHLSNAYKEGISAEAKSMELKSITELTEMIANVSAAITNGQQWEKSMQTLEENIGNLSHDSWDKMFEYIGQYQNEIREAYIKTYDETTQALRGQQFGLEEAMNNELKLHGETEKYNSYKEAYDYITEILDEREKGKQAAIDRVMKESMNQRTVERIRKAFLQNVDFVAVEGNMRSSISDAFADMGVNMNIDGALDAFIGNLFTSSGKLKADAAADYNKFIDSILKGVYGGDYGTVKKAIDSGFIKVSDVLPKEMIDTISASLLKNTDDPKVRSALQKFISGSFKIETDAEAKRRIKEAADGAKEEWETNFEKWQAQQQQVNEWTLDEHASVEDINRLVETGELPEPIPATLDFGDDLAETIDNAVNEAKPDGVEIHAHVVLDDIMTDMKEMLETGGIIDSVEEGILRNMYGNDLYEKAYKELVENAGEGNSGTAWLPAKAAQMGAAGVVGGMSPVYRGGGQQESGPDVVSEYTVDVGSSEEDNQALITGVTNGVKTANGDVVSALNVLAGWLQRIYNKDTTVVVQPSTSLGRAVGRSNSDLGRVTGYAVD